MLSWFYKGGFSGTLFVWEKVLPQSHRAGVNARSALNRQGGNIRVAAVLRVELFLSLVTVPSNVALVACKHAPVAQRADDSSSSSRRLAISLCPLRGYLKLSKTAPSKFLLKNGNTSMKSFGQINLFQEKAHLPNLRSDSFQKFATASQTLGFEKPSSLRDDFR